MTISKNEFSIFQKRRQWKRGLRNKFNPLLKKKYLEVAKDECFEDYEMRPIIFMQQEKDEHSNENYFNDLATEDILSDDDYFCIYIFFY